MCSRMSGNQTYRAFTSLFQSYTHPYRKKTKAQPLSQVWDAAGGPRSALLRVKFLTPGWPHKGVSLFSILMSTLTKEHHYAPAQDLSAGTWI